MVSSDTDDDSFGDLKLEATSPRRPNVWLVTFMPYDLGYFDDEAGRVEPIADPFGSKVLPMCSV